jgi:hypothetical protein
VIATPRIKSRWFRDGAPRDAADVATAAAAIAWRIANHRVAHMRSVDFAIAAGEPYVAALVEFLCFAITVADRIAFAHDSGEWRTRFTTALTVRVAELLDECLDELLGPDAAGGYKRRFIDRANERSAEYAQYRYGDSGPDFAMLRHFGEALAAALPSSYDRRWAADQAMMVEAPAAVETIARGMEGLLGRAPQPSRVRGAAG